MNRTVPRAALALLLLAAASAACSATARRQSRVRTGLDAYRYPRAVSEVWPAVQRLLHERGYQLVGDDRVAVGAPKRNVVLEALSAGFDTRTKANGSRILETNADPEGLRMRAEAFPQKDGGCRVIFTRLRRDDTGPVGNIEERDVELELVLLQRLDPVAAAGIEGVPVPPEALAAAAATLAPPDPWGPLRPLVGTWEAPAAGGLPALKWTFDIASGGQRMEFHGSPPLGPRAAGADGPEEMGVITRDVTRGKLVWRQFTGSGQVNEYLLERGDAERLVFVGEKAESLPAGSRVRLTLGRDGPDELVAVFEQAEPGKELAVSAESRLKRRR